MPSTADLIAEVHADIDPFRRGMNQAVQVAGSASQRIGGFLDEMRGGFDTLVGSVTSVQGAISMFSRIAVGGAALAGVTKTITGTLEGLAEISRSADAIGVSTDEFQELAYAMGRAGVAADDQAVAMRRFAEQAFAAASGEGKLLEALNKHNPAAAQSLQSARGLTAQLGVLGNAVREAASEYELAELMTAGFGKANDDLRRLLMGGADGIEQAAKEARTFGMVIDEELVRRAPEIQEQFRALSSVISVQFQNAMIKAAPVVVEFAGHLADLGGRVVPMVIASLRGVAREVNDLFAGIEGQSENALGKRLLAARADVAAISAELSKVNPNSPSSGMYEQDIMTRLAAAQARLAEAEAEVAAERARRAGIWDTSIVATPGFKMGEEEEEGEAAAERRKAGVAQAMANLDRIHGELLKTAKDTTAQIGFEYETQLAKLQESLDKGLISAEQFEQGRQDLAAISTVKLAEEEQKRFDKMAEEAQKAIQPISNALSGTLTRAFDDFLKTGEMNWQAWGAMALEQIAKVAFQMAVIQPLFGGGAGGGTGLVGQALAGVFHEGGIAGQAATRRAVPGLAFATAPRFHNGGIPGLRAGEVPAILERGETVIPKGGRGMGGRPIVFNINTPDADSFRRSEGQIAAMLTRATQRGQRNL